MKFSNIEKAFFTEQIVILFWFWSISYPIAFQIHIYLYSQFSILCLYFDKILIEIGNLAHFRTSPSGRLPVDSDSNWQKVKIVSCLLIRVYRIANNRLEPQSWLSLSQYQQHSHRLQHCPIVYQVHLDDINAIG